MLEQTHQREFLTRQRTGDPSAEPPRLLCVACRLPITSQAQQLEVDGAHRHTFANPYGYIHQIVCFAEAPGCFPILAETSEFTWFPGHTWQVVICGRCQVQLGWRFRSSSRVFFGLLAERLVAEKSGASGSP